MAEHRLDGTQVGAAFQQGGGEGMAQGVRTDRLVDAGIDSQLLDDEQDHRAGEVRTTAVEKHIILLTWFDVHLTTVVKPEGQFLDGLRGDGHQALLAALA